MTVDGLTDFCAQKVEVPGSGEARSAYAAEIARLGGAVQDLLWAYPAGTRVSPPTSKPGWCLTEGHSRRRGSTGSPQGQVPIG
jgi:hypothetical protein